MTTTTQQTPSGAAMDNLMARVRFQPFWGFMYETCPNCGSDALISQMRPAGHTHKPFTKCDDCRAHVGWSFDQDKAIRDQLRAFGVPVERRVA